MSNPQDYDTSESTLSGNPPDLNKVPVPKLTPYLTEALDRDVPETLQHIPRPERETTQDTADLQHGVDRKTTAAVTRDMRAEQTSSYNQ
jgi:hypothetical protein